MIRACSKIKRLTTEINNQIMQTLAVISVISFIMFITFRRYKLQKCHVMAGERKIYFILTVEYYRYKWQQQDNHLPTITI